MSEELKQFIRDIPKAELHVHLDSVYPKVLLRLAKRNQVALPFSDVEGAYRLFEKTGDLRDFLELWKTTTTVLQKEEDYAEVTVEMGADMERQNILRREAMFTFAAAHEGRNVPLDIVVNGLARGREEVKRRYGVDICFTADIDRTIDPERSLKFVNDIAEYGGAGVIAIGLDCQEVGYPAATHKAAFERARELGFHCCAHSGEEDGPDSVWSAIEDLEVDRVDHGVRAIEDDRLVQYLAENQLPLTVCPASNVSWIYPSFAAHPIKALMDRGVLVTVNSDDPPFILLDQNPVDLNENFIRVAEAFALSLRDIAGLARNSFRCSFATDEEKKAYLEQLDAWLVQHMPGADPRAGAR